MLQVFEQSLSISPSIAKLMLKKFIYLERDHRAVLQAILTAGELHGCGQASSSIIRN